MDCWTSRDAEWGQGFSPTGIGEVPGDTQFEAALTVGGHIGFPEAGRRQGDAKLMDRWSPLARQQLRFELGFATRA